MSAIPGKIDNRLVTWEGLKDYHNNFLKAIPKLGNANTVISLYSFGLGQLNNIEKEYSFGFGYNNTVSGKHSFGLGENNTVIGDNSFVVGTNLQAFGSQTIFGYNNEEDASILFAIGNGASPETPSNAFEIDRNSNIKFGSDHEVFGGHNFLMGNHLIAKENQVVFGQYNKEDENVLFMIGAGDKNQKKNLFSIEKTGSFKTFNTNILIQNDIEKEQNQILDVVGAVSSEVLYPTNNAIILGGKNNKIVSSYGFICGLNNLIDLTSTSTPISDTTSLKETPAFVLGKGLKISFNDTQARTGPILITGQYNDRNANYSNAAFVIGGGSSDQNRKNLLSVGYDGELWLGNCYLSSPLYGKGKTELIWPEESALRHSLFPIQHNEGVWAIHKDMMDDGTIDENLFINYRQPFEYIESSASSTSDYYVAPKNIIFNAGSHDSYATLVAAAYYNKDMTGHAIFYKNNYIGTPGVEYQELELPGPGLYRGYVGPHLFLISLQSDTTSEYFHVYDDYNWEYDNQYISRITVASYGVSFDYETKKLSGSGGGYIAYLENVRLILDYGGGWSRG